MRRAIILVLALAWGMEGAGQVTSATGAQAPGLPPRDSNVRPQTGTGTIRGRVVAMQTGQALRRAQVMLGGPVSRRAITDAAGRFEFAGLPAGSFFVNVQKPGYVGLQYGQRRPQEPGVPVVVADGQTVDRIDIALPRGSVIAVRVTDDVGEPVIGAQIQVLRFQYAPDGQRRLNQAPMGSGPSVTDDRGEYRAFGLAPGEYVVSATQRNQMFGGPTSTDDPGEGFGTTFYPGTANPELAQTISVGTGEESNIHFAMIPSRLARVSGTVSDSQGRPVAGAMLQLAMRQGNGVSSSGAGTVSADGSFTINGVAPGEYTIEVRPTPRPGVPFNQLEGEFASTPIVVAGADVTGVRVVTGPGATIAGRVVFDGAARIPNQLRVFLQPLEPGFLPVGQNSDPARNGTLGIDNRFQITGVSGRVFVQMNAAGWAMRSMTLDGRDVTDEPLDLTGKASVSELVITMTDKLAGVSGQVTDTRGAVQRYVVLIAPTDPMEPARAARLTRTLRPGTQGGRFQLRGIRPGRYFATAVEVLEDGRQFSAEFRQQLRRAGQEFTLREGETVTLDLKLSTGL